MPTLAEKKESVTLHALIYGQPKSGKTILACTFPRPRILDCDNGMTSVLWAIKEGIVPHKAEDITYETVMESDRSRGEVRTPSAVDRIGEIFDEWENERDEFDTVVIDSATALSDYCMYKAQYQLGQIGRGSKKDSQKVGFRIMAQQDWGGAQNLFVQIVDWARTTFHDKHVVLTAHEYSDMTESGYVRASMPLVIGQLRQRIVKDFDEVWYMEGTESKDGPIHRIRTRTDKQVVAGTRLGSLPQYVENPTFEKIMKLAGR